VDNVNIENVGGMRGVASEATLQSLVEAMRTLGAANGNNSADRLRELYDRSLRDGTRSQRNNNDALRGSTGSLKDFGKELAYGKERLSNLTSALLGGTSKIARLAGFVDELVDDFRSLSSVGASFNNSIFDMVSSSAAASMTINDFTQLIANNSEALTNFGGTATKGAKFFADFSRDIRLGIGSDFFTMGMTIKDINDGLVGFITIETMRGRRNLRSDAESQESAANYIRQLDLLSKLTGKQKSALQQEITALETDTLTRNILNRVEKERGEAARQETAAILAFTKSTMPSLNGALLDLSDGVAQSDLARALQNTVPGIKEFAMNMENMSMEEFQAGITKFAPALAKASGTISGATLQVMRDKGGYLGALAEIYDASFELTQAAGRNTKSAIEEQRKRNLITGALGKFEQIIINLRKSFLDTFIKSAFFTKLTQFGDQLLSMFDPNSVSNPFNAAGKSFQSAVENLLGKNGFLTNALERLSEFVSSGGLARSLIWLQNQATSIADWFSKFVKSVDANGLWKTIEDKFVNAADSLMKTFSNFWNDPTIQKYVDTFFTKMDEIFTKVGTSITDAIVSVIKDLLGGVGGTALSKSNTQALVDKLRGGTSLTLNEEQDLRQTLDPSTSGVINFLRDLTKIESLVGRQDSLLANATNQGFAAGTNGFQDFGKQTFTTLHGKEAVVPRNTPAGEILSQFYKSQKSPSSSTMSLPSSNNQTGLESKLDQLNNTMNTVAVLLSESVEVQRRMKKSIGTLGSDMSRG